MTIKEYWNLIGWEIILAITITEDTKILEFNQYQESDKRPFAFYADFESYLEKTDGCKNNLDKSFTTKKGKYIQSGFSLSTKSSFKF